MLLPGCFPSVVEQLREQMEPCLRGGCLFSLSNVTKKLQHSGLLEGTNIYSVRVQGCF